MDELKNLHNAETNDNSYDHVLKYTGIFGGVQGLKMLVSAVRRKLTAVLLGGEGMGFILVYNRVADFLNNASNMGIPLNATRKTSVLFEEGTDEEIKHQVMVIRTWVVWSALFSVFLSVFICLFFELIRLLVDFFFSSVLHNVLSPLLSDFSMDGVWSHWPEMILISLVVVCNIIAEGECAILKGLRQVRKVAVIETILALGTLLCTIPIYYLLGLRGVIIGLVACGFLSALAHFSFSLRLVSYKICPFSKKVFFDGLPLIKVGIPYVLAGIANSALQMIIPVFIIHTITEAGHFDAGWTLMIGYAGLVFVALDSDYFPRLSSVNHNKLRMNNTINQQIDACTLILAPLLILLVMFMPFVLRLLYEEEFLVATGMATLSAFYPFLRCISLPMGYSILAKGESIAYLVFEVIYDILLGLLIWWSYNTYGLEGAGLALSIGAFYDVVIYFLYSHFRYGFVFRRSTLLFCIGQFSCLLAAVEYCYLASPSIEQKYTIGGIAFAISLALSLYQLLHRSNYVRRLMKRKVRN